MNRTNQHRFGAGIIEDKKIIYNFIQLFDVIQRFIIAAANLIFRHIMPAFTDSFRYALNVDGRIIGKNKNDTDRITGSMSTLEKEQIAGGGQDRFKSKVHSVFQ